MLMTNRFARFACMGLLCFAIAKPAAAVIIPYGDFMGDDVIYLSVTEDTRNSPSALFGSPSISGNRLDFDPLSFTAAADSVTGSQITDGQLNFTVMSNVDDFDITNVVIEEAGDFTLVGPPSAFAEASVGTIVRFTVTHVDGIAISGASGSAIMTFTPNLNGEFAFPTDAGTASPWDGMLDIDIAAFLSGEGISGKATKIEFAIDNTLTATAADGGSAFIAKKDFNGVTIGVVPEPASILLLTSMLVGVGLIRRR